MFVVLLNGRMWKEIYALERCHHVEILRTQRVTAITRCEVCVETRECKDKMYLDAIAMSDDIGKCVKGHIRGRRCAGETQP